MADTLPTPQSITVVTTADQKPALTQLVKSLPGILSGRLTDIGGISEGFKNRIGYAILSLIAPNFNELGRGFPGADGEKWPPLSKEYLAYGRRFGPGEQAALKKAAGLGKAHRYAPGNKKGLLTKEQLKAWRTIYADRLAWYEMRVSDKKAKEIASRIAWAAVKKAGGKTKLEVYGNRVVQILVDTGRLRASIQPGVIYDIGPNASYSKPVGVTLEANPKPGTKPTRYFAANDQVFEAEATQLVVGTNVKYAGYHHEGKGVPQRRLWPAEFPGEWWSQILGVAISGLTRIVELYGGGKGV